MARPRSEDKYQTIIRSAIALFADEGLNASTARIAKAAGVAEGTIFLYFSSKDELINRVYLELKSQLRLSFELPSTSTALQEQLRQFWSAYVSWGLRHPVERAVLSKLEVSGRISEASKAAASERFHDVIALLVEAMQLGVLRNQSPAFVGALFVAMAETAIDFIGANAEVAQHTDADAFAAFWRALTAS